MSNENGTPATRVHDVVHTPGPWTIEPHGKGFALYSGRDNEHHGLNLVYLTEPDWNWEANAKLIAAAPSLLKALQEIASKPTVSAAWAIAEKVLVDTGLKVV